MPPTEKSIDDRENDFYSVFLDKAVMFAENSKEVDGVRFKHLVSAASVVAKQRQTRLAAMALKYQIERDEKEESKGIAAKKMKLLPAEATS